VDYDALCADPDRGLAQLADFLFRSPNTEGPAEGRARGNGLGASATEVLQDLQEASKTGILALAIAKVRQVLGLVASTAGAGLGGPAATKHRLALRLALRLAPRLWPSSPTSFKSFKSPKSLKSPKASALAAGVVEPLRRDKSGGDTRTLERARRHTRGPAAAEGPKGPKDPKDPSSSEPLVTNCPFLLQRHCGLGEHPPRPLTWPKGHFEPAPPPNSSKGLVLLHIPKRQRGF